MGGSVMTTTAAEEQKTMMKAVVRDRYGPPELVEIREVPKPQLPDDGILVRVRASSLNKGDWHALTGTPVLARPLLGGILKPKSPVLGSDFAGIVEAVGSEVTDLAPGDEVFGGRSGSLAEYVDSRTGFGRKPANLTFEEAAAVPVAALTALQGLRDHGCVQAGQRVLVNGASGGVGTFAIQVAKALGAEVTAVCSTRNLEQAGELGADEAIDYTKHDFTRTGQRFHVVLDIAVTRSWSAYRRVLEQDGRLVIVGAKGGRLLEGLGRVARIKLAALRGSQKAGLFIAKFNRPDVDVLRDLAERGKIKPVIEKRYELSEIADALRYLGEGHARGKLVVTI
jgi:NADPH:quinone reductase-like Zn-dependent oxidoreductase